MADGRWRMALACCALLFSACREKEKNVLPPPDSIIGDIELDEIHGPNLLSLARGASVVSRTAELTLENSATHSIDGDWLTFWRSPPGGAEQTIIFSLAARARIDRLGVITPQSGNEAPSKVRFEASDDGVTWREIATLDLKAQRDPQLTNVTPFDTTYLRVQTIAGTYYSAIHSLIAMGREIAPPRQPPIEGCWEINGLPARFAQRGTSVFGVIGSDPPMYVSGGADGRTIRLQWLRGAMWGPAIITLDPQRRALSGEKWHESVREQNAGQGWFGTPSQCNDVAFDETEIAAAILKRAGKWVAYGDSALDTIAALIARAPAQQIQVTAPNAGRLAAVRAKVGRSSRVELTVATPKTLNETQRVIADGVALRVR